jgi:hypothetical protein
LKTELEIGLAPDATIDVQRAPNSNTGLIDIYKAILDNESATRDLDILGRMQL